MSHDFEFEPLPGLPAALPAGERLLWQGAPQWRALAVRSYHVRKVAGYFGVLIAWSLAHGVFVGQAPRIILVSCAMLLLAGTAGVAVLSLLAYLSARSTVYSITSRRVLIRHGIAVPMTLNLPLSRVDGVALRDRADDSGDLALRVGKDDRVGYLITWPHVRANSFARPEPSLVAIPNVRSVAEQLVRAIEPEARQQSRSPVKAITPPRPAHTPASLLPDAVA